MEDKIKQEAYKFLDRINNEKVVVWGAGLLGRWLMEKLGNNGVGFIDNNPTKEGTKILGRKVYSPAHIEDIHFDKVWIATIADMESISYWLSDRGLEEKKDFEIIFKKGKLYQFLDRLDEYNSFLDGTTFEGNIALEVGSGGHLFLSLLLLYCGAEEVTVTDAVPHRDKIMSRYMDQYREFVKALRRRLPDKDFHGEECEVLCRRVRIIEEPISACELPCESSGVDIICNSGVMEHINEPRRAIEEFWRVLRPGGLAICLAIGIHDHRSNDPHSGFNPWSFLEYSEDEWRMFGQNPYHQNRWRAVDFKNAFIKTGFSIYKYKTDINNSLTQDQFEKFDRKYKKYSLRDLCEMNLWIAAEKQG